MDHLRIIMRATLETESRRKTERTKERKKMRATEMAEIVYGLRVIKLDMVENICTFSNVLKCLKDNYRFSFTCDIALYLWHMNCSRPHCLLGGGDEQKGHVKGIQAR